MGGKYQLFPWFHLWFDRTSMLMIEPYPTPKSNLTAKPNPIPCPKPNYVDKF